MLSSGIQVPAIYEFYVNQKDQFKAEKFYHPYPFNERMVTTVNYRNKSHVGHKKALFSLVNVFNFT
ncbi:hypothetical protein [Heyndrickxia ginsengihumi]|nr:hypothetical protein [Heyndrickxia ginsengihumi]